MGKQWWLGGGGRGRAPYAGMFATHISWDCDSPSVLFRLGEKTPHA